ncbi:Myc-type, basic helix-loop-helix (bHLH) domain [Dillenia turbinata]|uniref:Myc-type, basic helix-loop-helix (BHLH) domain n=1 Tax=Dillenia turbinata TaxID=194707 RepID=A0AAN8UW25_9MAGN
MEGSSRHSSTRPERKIIEKNRRCQMKTLYAMLGSLLPNHNSKETMSVPDKITEATNYIKSLQKSLEEKKEKRNRLMGGTKRLKSCPCNSPMPSSSNLPRIEIKGNGPALEVALITGLDNQFIFYEIIRMLHQENADVVSANFSVVGNVIFHVVHAEMGNSNSPLTSEAARISDRLNQFVNGTSTCTRTSTRNFGIEQELWDSDVFPEVWEV